MRPICGVIVPGPSMAAFQHVLEIGFSGEIEGYSQPKKVEIVLVVLYREEMQR
jgi:hypothetical protein